MADTQDLSKIINVIMQNPELIEQISSLVRADGEKADASAAEEITEVKAEEKTEKVSAEPLMRAHRHELLNAMKPYLSENRRAAIDSMSSILDVLDVMMKK